MKNLKKAISIFILAAFIIGIVPIIASAAVPPGYILVSTPAEFYAIRNNLSRNYILGADIDLSVYPKWDAIGTSLSKCFEGTLDGNNFTIKGLSFGGNTDTDYGLFGYARGATIVNLKLTLAPGTMTGKTGTRKGALAGSLYNSLVENVTIEGNGGTIQGGDYSGGMAGGLNGSIVRNCSVSNLTLKANANYAGGFSGVAYSDSVGNNEIVSITDCSVSNVNVSTGAGHAGGFVGYVYDPTVMTTYQRCQVFNAEVTSKSSYAGGFAGKIYQKSLIEDCTVYNAKVASTDMYYAGGFVGHVYGPARSTTVMKNCMVCTTTVEAKNIAGGFAGMFGLTTEQDLCAATSCYANNVDVKVTNTAVIGYYAGGWAGKIWRAAVSESYATGKSVTAVSKSSGYCVGGFVGEMAYDASAVNCYAQFESVNGMKWLGGFVGYLSSVGTNYVYNCYGVAKINPTYATPVSGSFSGFSSGGNHAGTNYFDSTVSPIPGHGNTMTGHIQGYDTATMMKRTSFVGWDFNNIWKIDENQTYPYFIKTLSCAPGQPGEVRTVDVKGTVSWIDGGESSRPATVKVGVFRNGQPLQLVQVSSYGDGSFEFVGLDKFAPDGSEYVYTVNEQSVPGYRITINGYNIVNTRLVAKSAE